MDLISELSDELLIKILLLLPTKLAVSTSLLSKRWECLWMWLPVLEYDLKRRSLPEHERLRCFLDRNLPLHRAPVLERLCLKLGSPIIKPKDVKLYVLTAVSRIIRELEIVYDFSCIGFSSGEPNILPSNLYTSKSLVILKLRGIMLLDVPRFVCLASLETLHLQYVAYFNEGSFQRILSICPVLKHLLVARREDDKIGKLSVIHQSLQSLTIDMSSGCAGEGYLIDTPSLEYFKLRDDCYENHGCIVGNMPKLMEAYIEVEFSNIKSLIGSITAVKRLSICSEAIYDFDDAFVFDQLEHLKFCMCKENASRLLVRLLKDSPKLRVLELFVMDNHDGSENELAWNRSYMVPECLFPSLRTFKWSGYEGTRAERKLVAYILKNASHLKNAIILSGERQVPMLQMMRELSLSSRASSSACQVTLHW